MQFPDVALIKFLYWLNNTPGLGGVAVGLLGAAIVIGVGLTLHWVAHGEPASAEDEYAFPTPTLLHRDAEDGRPVVRQTSP